MQYSPHLTFLSFRFVTCNIQYIWSQVNYLNDEFHPCKFFPKFNVQILSSLEESSWKWKY
jgi:hypothetical protein